MGGGGGIEGQCGEAEFLQRWNFFHTVCSKFSHQQSKPLFVTDRQPHNLAFFDENVLVKE